MLAEWRPDAAPALGHAIRSRKLTVAELAASVLAGEPHLVHEIAGSLDLDVGLTGSVLALMLFPVLVPIQAGLEPLVSAGSWTEGYCPVCGSFPKLGEFRGLEQIRFLRCGLCAAQWPKSSGRAEPVSKGSPPQAMWLRCNSAHRKITRFMAAVSKAASLSAALSISSKNLPSRMQATFTAST